MIRKNIENIEGVKGIIFDCYETLIDLEKDEQDLETYHPVCNWMKYYGIELSSDELRSEYKLQCHEEIKKSSEKYPELKVEEVFGKICQLHATYSIDAKAIGFEAARLFRSSSVRRLKAFPKSERLLVQLRDYPLAMVCNGQRVFSEPELKYLGLYKYFKIIIFSSDLGYKKPDSRIFIAGANRLGLNPDEVMYIGDSETNDIIPSRNLGMKAMHIRDAWRIYLR